jgi:hypothetical protein
MSITTITEFKDYCLRKLGSPVIQINLDDTQITDAIEDAILKFVEYHRDGSEEYFLTYTFPDDVTAATRKITVPEGVDDVVKVISPGSSIYGGRFDTYAWQAGAAITSPVTGGWAQTSLQDFTVMMQRLADLSVVLSEVFPFKFSKYHKEIELLFKVNAGEVLAFQTYKRIDPRDTGNEYAWNDFWLKDYATAKIKERWGNVLNKLQGVRLPGGVELNGAQMLQEAKEEIRELEDQLKKGHQEPIDFFVG